MSRSDLILSGAPAILAACAGAPVPPESLTAEGPMAAESSTAEGPAAATETLTGTLRLKPWSKTLESFQAGGSDYFVLEPGEPGGSPEGRILLPSDAVSVEQLKALDGQRVEVTGAQVAGRPFVPDPSSQHPIQYAPDGTSAPAVQEVGGGFEVLTVRAVAP